MSLLIHLMIFFFFSPIFLWNIQVIENEETNKKKPFYGHKAYLANE